MITAHLPSGYIGFRALNQRSRLVLLGCLIGGIFPDLDLIWFYLIDNREIHHHRYWVHAPAFWLAVTCVSLPVLRMCKPDLRSAGIAFLGMWFVHLCLDSVVGSVMWLWPFSDKFFQLANVPATQSHFVLSFILHWSFLLEVAIWGVALVLFAKKPAS